MLNKQQFYLLWDVECLKYAATHAYKVGISLAQTQLWIRSRYVKNLYRNPNRFMPRKYSHK